MRILNFTSDKDNITVKQILSNVYSMKASVITALKNSGGILVNENVATVRETLNRGDTLKLIIPEKQTSDIVPVKGDLDILYEDDDILCVNKKRGMPTHPSQNHHDDIRIYRLHSGCQTDWITINRALLLLPRICTVRHIYVQKNLD